jgi:hypothetical protein
VGNIITLSESSDLSIIAKGDILTSGIEKATSMGPNGAVQWLAWRPITITNRAVKLPDRYNLNSDAPAAKQ